MNLVGDIIAQRSLLDYLPPGWKLTKTGKDAYRCVCPIVESGPGAFAIRRHARGHLVFKCFSCNTSGTVIDLYAALNKCSIRTAIVKLAAGAERMSPEAEMQHAADRVARERSALYVLTCDAPRCTSMLKLDSILDAVLALVEGGHAGNWFVAPDGIGALCPRHA